MRTGAGAAARRFTTVRSGPAVEQWAATRQVYLDNLKVVLIAAIIVMHAIIGYAEVDWWSYADVREVTLQPATQVAVVVIAAPVMPLVIPLLFLVAGILTRPSLERKGPAAYVRDRLLRLGVPFVVFALLLWPFLEYALFRWLGAAPGLWRYLRQEGSLDTGVLWFVGALLVFSLVYAGSVAVRHGHVGRLADRPIDLPALVALTLVVAALTFVVRLWVPFETDNPIVDLNVWEWPACAGMFTLGILASRHGWLVAVPDRLWRQARTATCIGVVLAGVFGLLVWTLDLGDDQILGGFHWPALLMASGESVLSVFGPVWMLHLAQLRLARPLPWVRPAVSRSAYGAFMLQGLVLIGLALLLRPVALPAEIKAIAVAACGVAGSFGAAWLLISRVPGVSRFF